MEMDKENSMSKSIKKKCTKCLAQKKASEFYEKEGQRDSICKECRKIYRRKKYISEKKVDELSRLVDLSNVMLWAERERLEEVDREVKTLLERIENRRKFAA